MSAVRVQWSRILMVLAVATTAVLAMPVRAGAVIVPAGFTDTLVATVPSPTDLEPMPDGRLLATSQDGRLWVIRNGVRNATPALSLGSQLCANSERGLLGVAADPNPGTRAIYVFYTHKGTATDCPAVRPEGVGAPRNRVSRFTIGDNDIVDPTSEVVLIDGIRSTAGNHNAGDLHVGNDGFLYVTTGDGGCDYSTDSGCGGGNDASRDRNILNGKILRITTDGGIPADNPFVGANTARCHITGETTAGRTCQEAWATGLRNPFRFAFDPNTTGTRFFVNDVGQNIWEEIDLGIKGADYGWNLREGHCQRTESLTDCGTTTPAQYTDPFFDYSHSTGCGSITGGAFVPNGVWPAAYSGAYLYADYVCGQIFALSPSKESTPLISGLGASSAVALTFARDGTTQSLFYTSYANGGEVRKIRYSGSVNQPPSAALTATPTAGRAPLDIGFDGSGSHDPEGGSLSYRWDFGDGTALQTTSTPMTSHRYTTGGTRTATLTVTDPAGLSASASVVVRPGNALPMVAITAPAPTRTFSTGAGYLLRATATDAEDGTLPASALTWTVLRHHDQHTHPYLGPVTGNDVALIGPEPEDLAAAANSYLEISVTAADSGGATSTVTQRFDPQKVPVTFGTSPIGRTVTVNGDSLTGPTTVTSWAGYRLSLGVPTQTASNGVVYGFERWSDGGAASHVVTTGSTAVTLTATLSSRSLPTAPINVWAGQTGSGTATLAWSPPTSTGGSPITGYLVSRDGTDTAGKGPWSTTVAADVRNVPFTLLAVGSTYRLSVQAITAAGAGPVGSSPVTTAAWHADQPTAATAVSVSATGSSATIRWQPPSSTFGHAVTGYRISRDGTNAAGSTAASTTTGAAARAFTVTNLVAGNTYTLRVEPITDAGRGPAIGATVVAGSPAKPTAPGMISLSQPSAGQERISWSVPTVTAGRTITGWVVTRSGTNALGAGPGTVTLAASTRSFTSKNLIRQATYTLSVRAIFSDGTSSPVASGAIRVR